MPHPKWVFGSDHGHSADVTGAPAILLEDSHPQAILKLWPPNSFDYMVSYEPQPIIYCVYYLGSYPDGLHSTEVQILNNQVCADLYGPMITETMMCTSGRMSTVMEFQSYHLTQNTSFESSQ